VFHKQAAATKHAQDESAHFASIHSYVLLRGYHASTSLAPFMLLNSSREKISHFKAALYEIQLSASKLPLRSDEPMLSTYQHPI